MKIKVDDILDEGKSIELYDKLHLNGLEIDGPVSASLFLKKIREDIFLSGTVSLNVILSCNRCLNTTRKNITVKPDLTILPIKALEDEDSRQLLGDELEICFYSDSELDIHQIIGDQIFLNLPMKLLCSDDCKGLCIQCGQNLNITTCRCESEVSDNRFKILEKLIK